MSILHRLSAPLINAMLGQAMPRPKAPKMPPKGRKTAPKKPRAKAAPDPVADFNRTQAAHRASRLEDHAPDAGDHVPRYSPKGFPAPIWSLADLGKAPTKTERRTPRPLYGPEYNHKRPTKATIERQMQRADGMDKTPRHAPSGFPAPVWSDADLERWKVWRSGNALTGHGPRAGSLPDTSTQLEPWKRKALSKAAKLEGGGSITNI